MVRIGHSNGGASGHHKGKLLFLLQQLAEDPIKSLCCLVVLAGMILVLLGLVVSISPVATTIPSHDAVSSPQRLIIASPQNHQSDVVSKASSSSSAVYTCPYMKLVDLSASERYPEASATRHMVNPPPDDKTTREGGSSSSSSGGVALVCCETSQGPWNILVHHTWAKIGARRFLDLVEAKHFHQPVPMMRCVENFLCQFGLNGNTNTMKRFQNTIPDDPNWLPEGKEFRKNQLNVKRFQKGYLAYAGSGTSSRNLQFIVALEDNGPLAGGSPWEVPWGELVGEHSYQTLAKIYTGYGEEVTIIVFVYHRSLCLPGSQAGTVVETQCVRLRPQTLSQN
jgi:cyclophilin family peptidyl-prolyl cis-trans isomerase